MTDISISILDPDNMNGDTGADNGMISAVYSIDIPKQMQILPNRELTYIDYQLKYENDGWTDYRIGISYYIMHNHTIIFILKLRILKKQSSQATPNKYSYNTQQNKV